MKLSTAREIGDFCGLTQDCEHVNNILLHGSQLLGWDTLGQEIDELLEDAKAQGVKFSQVCGDAIADDADVSLPCHFCTKVGELVGARKDGAD